VIRVTWALCIVLCSACVSLPFNNADDGEGDWDGTLGRAQALAGAGHFEAADSVLAGFAARHPGTPATLETAYWRAIYKLDPSSRAVSVTQALAWLDGYLADPRPRAHLAEATTLRRTAAQLEALNKLAASASAQAKDASRDAKDAKAVAADAKAEAKNADANANAVADAKDNEIKRLRDELAKANAELERIRKRLSAPPGRSPHSK
jgi:hypothetical protein